MKKIIFLITIVTILSTFFLVSCERGEELEDNKIENGIDKKIEYHIHYATWDEWGRAKKNCKGWGLCNYNGCWFCCTDGGVIVDCDSTTKVQNSATIIIDKETNQGFFIIELDPLIEIQNDAIINEKIFYIDEDIIEGNTILHKGEYNFDIQVGKHGGYRLNITAI